MTTPTAKKIDPAAATVGSAEDSATGFDLAFIADTTTNDAYHQAVAASYVNTDDEAQVVTEAYPFPTVECHASAGRDPSSTFTTGSVAVVAGDYLGAFEVTSTADRVAVIHSLCLSWSTALWPADAEVDLYVYNSTLANTGWAGAVGDAWTCPVPSSANGALLGKVRLTNDCIGTAFGLVASPWLRFHHGTADITWVAVYAAGANFTTATPLTLSITAELQP